MRHGGHRYRPAAGHGRPVGRHPTVATEAATATPGWAARGGRASGPDRYSVRAQDRDPLGVSSAGNGLRLRDDLLAAATRLAAGGRVGPLTPRAARPSAGRRPDRLVASGGGQCQRARGWGGPKTGPNPTDRRKKGSKHHVLTDAQGTPLVFRLTSANANDGTQLLALGDGMPPVKGRPGAPRRRPAALYSDRAYYSHLRRMLLYLRGIEPHLAQPRAPHASGLGKYRWVVERTLSWLHQFRRLRVRYERRADIHEGFLSRAWALICWNRLTHGFC